MAEDSLPTAEEYALFREAYAETYPVRPLLNAIDAKDAEIERLRRERDEAQERFEELRDVVYNEANVDRERLRAALEKIARYELDEFPENHASAMRWIADNALRGADEPAIAAESKPVPPGYRG